MEIISFRCYVLREAFSSVYRKYNEQGDITEESYEVKNEVEKVYYFTYDSLRNIQEKREEHPAYPHLKRRYTYEYDAQNQCILETQFDEKDKFLNQYKFTYDEHGNQTRTTYMKNWKRIDFEIVYVYTYDHYGNWILKAEHPTSKYLAPEVTVRVMTYY